MRRTGYLFLVVSSLWCADLSHAATRPRYGRTLHVALRAAPTSLEVVQSLAPAAPELTDLLFDKLVTLDAQAHPLPQLATSWHAEQGNRRWQFVIRPGVTFHDGTPLTSDTVASALRAANPSWQVSASDDSVLIISDAPLNTFPAELSLPRNSISRHDAAGKVVGTGPFRVSDFQSARKLTLAANDDYWNARPYLDSIEVELSANPRDQLIALELGKSDVVDIAPEQVRRATSDGRRILESAPLDLLALVFTRDRRSSEEGHLRDALSSSLDRSSMRSALLQGEGEIAGAILPQWISGYEFLFPAKLDLARAQQLKGGAKQSTPWTLSYNANDPLGRLLADRVALNARDSGITIQVNSLPDADLRLVRMPLASVDPHLALRGAALAVGAPTPAFAGASLEQLYQAERALLDTQRVIPLLHLPRAQGIGTGVRNWRRSQDGAWRLDDVWLATEKP